jgi:ribose 5-phosphate isomerase B
VPVNNSMNEKLIAIASDHAGLALKETLGKEMESLGFDVRDLGPHDTQSVDYPDYANVLCDFVNKHKGSKGILICGSGIGMSIAANRHAGIRAALCSEALSARLSRQHNNANVLCLGERLIGVEIAKDCVTQFLKTEFEAGRHQGRVTKLG